MDSCEMELSLIHWSLSVKYILIAAQKDRATELRDKLVSFRDRFRDDLMIDIRLEQGLVFAPDSDCSTCLIRSISRHKR